MEEDDELANELKEKEEASRIQERMTLAHKNTSKWAKRILKRGKNVDVETRRALSAQLKRGEDLRKKMMGDESEGSENESDEDLVESARKVLADTDDSADPTRGKTGLFKLSFMQKGIEKQRQIAKEEARKLLSELEANEMDDLDGAFEDKEDSEDLNEKKKTMASETEMQVVLKTGDLVAKGLEFGNSNTIATSGGIDIDISEGTGQKRLMIKENTTSDTKTLSVKGSLPSKKSAQEGESNDKRKSSAAVTSSQHGSREEKSNPWMQSNDGAAKSSISKPKKSSRGMVDVAGAVNLLDGGKGDEENSEKKRLAASNEDGSEKMITMLSQEELVKRAFAGPSEEAVEEEFEKEKEAMAIENDPTRKSSQDEDKKEVAGWGSWTGNGALPPPRRKKLPRKLQAPKKKDDPKRKRMDDDKKNVIINQKRIKRMANNYMLGDVPHPYKSRAEYEQAMMGGMGTEWNVTSSFKNMTRSEILTRSGKIIVPISKKAKVARAPAKF